MRSTSIQLLQSRDSPCVSINHTLCSASDEAEKGIPTNHTLCSASDEEEEGIPGLFTIQRDGLVLRSKIFSQNVDACEAYVDDVASKDVVVDSDKDLVARIFVPRQRRQKEEGVTHKKLPVTLFVHGGGFCMLNASSLIFHDFCTKMALKANTLVLSINYRLAPEHRLPAAYNDCFDSLKWLQSQARNENIDPWLDVHADFSRCFWFGVGAGANVVHHVVLRAATEDLRPLQVQGAILSQPLFGSEARTASETELDPNEFVIPVASTTEIWKFSLPHGANRDHPFANPLNEVFPHLLTTDLPRMMVVVGGLDPLSDRQLAYIHHLHEAGKNAKLLYFEDAVHGFRLLSDHSAHLDVLLQYVVKFMHRYSKPT